MSHRFSIAESDRATPYYEELQQRFQTEWPAIQQGLGSRLIAAAQESARRFGAARLYALTELPALYSRLDWSIFSRRGTDFIMTWDAGDGERSASE